MNNESQKTQVDELLSKARNEDMDLPSVLDAALGLEPEQTAEVLSSIALESKFSIHERVKWAVAPLAWGGLTDAWLSLVRDSRVEVELRVKAAEFFANGPDSWNEGAEKKAVRALATLVSDDELEREVRRAALKSLWKLDKREAIRSVAEEVLEEFGFSE